MHIITARQLLIRYATDVHSAVYGSISLGIGHTHAQMRVGL